MLVAKIEKAAGSVVCYCVWVVETDDDTCVDSLVLRMNFNSWAVLHWKLGGLNDGSEEVIHITVDL